MIKTLEKSGRTEAEALAAALEELGLDRDDVSYEIVERAKSGFLGIGASPAVIRVSYEVEDEFVAAGREKFVRELDFVRFDEAGTDFAALREREGVRHRAADQDFVANPEEVFDDVDLVGDFRAAEDRDERALRSANRVGQVLDFLFDEETADARFAGHRFRNGDHRSVGAVAGAERVVDVNVGEGGEFRGEFGVALLFARLETEVFENDDVAVGQRGDFRFRVGADGVGREVDFRVRKEFAETNRRRFQRVFGVRFVLRTAEVAHQNDLTAAFEDGFDRRERHTDAAIVGDVPVFVERDVEIDANQNLLTGDVDVSDRFFRHCKTLPILFKRYVLLKVCKTTPLFAKIPLRLRKFRKKSAPICKFYFFLRVLIKNRLLRRPRIDYNKAYFNGDVLGRGADAFPTFLLEFPRLLDARRGD